MVRAPCCEKMGLKRGPWTTEEDQILISYIQQHGHGNWRALPKQAGLLRCGKSCRLRWINYLRLDIKRGNFSKEEEETIINLHQMLGNRWSAIAARLPGRTDNEIKNVWHTHLKKKLKNHENTREFITTPKCHPKFMHLNSPSQPGIQNPGYSPVSPHDSFSEISSVTNLTGLPNNIAIKEEQIDEFVTNSQVEKTVWSEELSTEKLYIESEFSGMNFGLQYPIKDTNDYNVNMGDATDFWYNLLNGAGNLVELPEF